MVYNPVQLACLAYRLSHEMCARGMNRRAQLLGSRRTDRAKPGRQPVGRVLLPALRTLDRTGAC